MTPAQWAWLLMAATTGGGPGRTGLPPVHAASLHSGGDAASDAGLLPADPDVDRERTTAVPGVVAPDPGRGTGSSVAPGGAVRQRPRTHHRRDRGRLLGPRSPHHPRPGTSRPGVGGHHPPRPARRAASAVATGGRSPRPAMAVPRGCRLRNRWTTPHRALVPTTPTTPRQAATAARPPRGRVGTTNDPGTPRNGAANGTASNGAGKNTRAPSPGAQADPPGVTGFGGVDVTDYV